jgi:hypothetical protein
MRNNIFMKFSLSAFALLLFLSACRKRDALLPDTLLNFETTQQGINAYEDSIKVNLVLNRAEQTPVTVEVDITEKGLAYGSNYRTSPAATNGKINLLVPAGQQSVNFTVYKTQGVFYYGDEQLLFSLNKNPLPALLGVRKNFTLDFAELIAQGSSAVINGGGAQFPNKVFIDLSANRTTAVNRNNWDLGFYCGGDDFRVTLNSSTAMMAKQLAKTDLTQVTTADTVGLSTLVAFSLYSPTNAQLPFIDYPNGDLTRTAIAAVSEDPAQNKVYVVNRGSGPGNPAPARGWKKIRVLRDGNGYKIQYADLGATTFQEMVIPKEDAYHFTYLSFETGRLKVDPEKKKWDLAWTYFSNVSNFGGGEVPYLFQDIILLNRGVQSVRLMNTTKAFDAFSEADLAGLSFSSSQIAIGADWRSGGGPGTAPAVRTDRYYIVKDPGNNYYKVRFTALTQNGERGYPAYEAVLVKKG